MSDESPIEFVSPSPEHVLEVLRDWHRHDPIWGILTLKGPLLHMHTTVAQWREECELLPVRQLGEAMNEAWNISLSPTEWMQTLEPARSRSLRGVCELISSTARVPKPARARILGRDCGPAATFLAIRQILIDAGESPDELAPSTPIHEYVRRSAGCFVGQLVKLAPGRLPRMKVHDSMCERIARWSFFTGFLLTSVGLVDMPLLTFFGGMLIGGSCLAMIYVARHVLPKSVEFGNLTTFRDLAIALSGPPIFDAFNAGTATR